MPGGSFSHVGAYVDLYTNVELVCQVLISYLPYIFGQTGLSKQCRSRDAVSSGSTLFATHPAVFNTISGSKLYLFKF